MDLDDNVEWDVASITRYDKLLMFETEHPIIHMCLINEDRLLTSGKKNESSVLTSYSLPPRLKALPPREEGLSKEYDLKIKNGIFTSYQIKQIATINGEDSFVASQIDCSGINIYKAKVNDVDKIEQSRSYDCGGLVGPYIAVSNRVIAACNQSSSPVTYVETKDGTILSSWDWPDPNACGELIPVLLSPNLSMVSSTFDRKSYFYDSREGKPHLAFDGGENSLWSVAGSWVEGSEEQSRIAFLSDEGSLYCYDQRALKEPFCKGQLGSCKPNSIANGALSNKRCVISFSPANHNMVCVTGLDSRVYVIDVAQGFNTVFVHDGHEHTESCKRETVTIDQLWYPAGGSNFIISSATNSSLNCWSYK